MAHRMDPRQSQQQGGGGDGDGDDGGGGACGYAGGGAACIHHARGCRTGSPEMPKDSARTQTREGEVVGQSDAAHVLTKG